MQELSPVSDHTTSQLFIAAAGRWSDRVRWRVPEGNTWKPVTWKTYRQQVFQIAAALHDLGYKYDTKIGILAPNSMDWIYAALGIMLANCILVPIYAGNTPRQSNYVINHSGMKVLFAADPETLKRVVTPVAPASKLEAIVLLTGRAETGNSRLPVITLEDLYQRGKACLDQTPGSIHDLARQPRLDRVAYLIYTSGTTGDPKGVPLTHANLAISTNDWLQVNGPLIPDEVVDIHWLPNAHIYGWGAVGLGNIFSFESYLADPQNVLELLPQVRPHIFMSVPAYFEKLYLQATTSSSSKPEQLHRLQQLTGGRIQFLLSGGAGLKGIVKEFFLEAGMWITEGYGLSECSPTLTMNRREAYRFDSVGLPFPSVRLKLGQDGEILAKGGNVFAGYYKDPQASREAFTIDGWFKTGDVGEWLEGGFLRIIDRKKDIIVTSGGKNVAPQYVESMFKDEPYIEHLVVYGEGKKYLVALVTLNRTLLEGWARDHHLGSRRWEELCSSREVYDLIQAAVERGNQNLAAFETIKYFRIIPDHFNPANGFLTAALKMRRKEIYRHYGEQLESLYQESELVGEKGLLQ